MKITILPFITVFLSLWLPAFASYYDCNKSHIPEDKVLDAIENYKHFQQNHGYLMGSLRQQNVRKATIDFIDHDYPAYKFKVNFDQHWRVTLVYSKFGRERDPCKYVH